MQMADSRAGKLIAAVLDEHGSRLKPVIRNYGRREALTFVDSMHNLNLLQISVLVGNISAGNTDDAQPLF